MEIVERLRDMQSKKYSKEWAAWVQTQCSQAADEIERLREALSTAQFAVEAEREACAMVCEKRRDETTDLCKQGEAWMAHELAMSIRDRSNAGG